METFTVLDAGRAAPVRARVIGERVLLEPASLEAALGGGVHDGLLCNDAMCIPLADEGMLLREGGVDLWAQGRPAAAERHFARGGELAPHDFTIRRGTMPMRGIDPMGPQFREMLQSWIGAGQPYYRPLPDTRGRAS